ncbi:Uma2 family endonuclease [Yinghuangia aomiensis]
MSTHVPGSDVYKTEMFARILRHLDEHPELTDDVRFESTPTGIVAKSPADAAHGRVINGLRRQLLEAVSRFPSGELDVSNDAGFIVGGQRKIPDLFVIDYTRLADEANGYVQDVSGVLLFVEVTSPATRRTDLGIGDPGKPGAYAAAGVPLYLVVDRAKARVLLFSQPTERVYPEPTEYEIGEAVWLPSPFSCTIDTEFMKNLL